jgi:hypothetical protein
MIIPIVLEYLTSPIIVGISTFLRRFNFCFLLKFIRTFRVNLVIFINYISSRSRLSILMIRTRRRRLYLTLLYGILLVERLSSIISTTVSGSRSTRFSSESCQISAPGFKAPALKRSTISTTSSTFKL